MMREYFRILAPFTHIQDIKLLKNVDVDELYCGYVTEELTKRWPLAFNVLNRRGEGQSFESYDLFRKAVEQANKYHLPVYVAINGLYTPEQYPFLLDLVNKVERLQGVKGIIIADLGLLLTLKKNGFKKEIHISAGGTCFNSKTADFYQGLGAHRIILPRQLTSNEIKNIVMTTKFKIDIELFILREPCGGFIDGYCTFFHCYEKPAAKEEKIKKSVFLRPVYNTAGQAACGCMFYFTKELAKGHFETLSPASYKQKNLDLRYQPDKHIFSALSGCRLCDLYDLKGYPIKSLKIIGRGNNPKDTVKLVKLTSQALSYLAGNGISKRDFKRKCKNLFSKIALENKRRCTKFDCYFDEHWVKNEKKI